MSASTYCERCGQLLTSTGHVCIVDQMQRTSSIPHSGSLPFPPPLPDPRRVRAALVAQLAATLNAGDAANSDGAMLGVARYVKRARKLLAAAEQAEGL